LVRHFGSNLAFHWNYALGLANLCLASFQILKILLVEPDPNLFSIYDFLRRTLIANCAMGFGLIFLAAAVLQDVLLSKSFPDRRPLK